MTSLYSLRGENLIINPSWEIPQRGTSIPFIVGQTYIADRFYGSLGTISGHSLTYHDLSDAAAATPVVPLPPNAISSSYGRIKNNVAVPVLDVNDFGYIAQKVEGYNARKIYNKEAYLVKKMRTSKAGTYSVFMGNNAFDQTIYFEFDLLADTWTTVKIPVPKLDTSIGTWNSGDQIGLYVGTVLFGGSGRHMVGPESTWDNHGGSVFVGPNQVNWSEDLDNYFYTTEWQLHEGVDEIPFAQLARPFDEELEKCQRYYEKSYDLDVAPGTADPITNMPGFEGGSGNSNGTAFFLTRKRTPGPINQIYDSLGNAFRYDTNTGPNNTPNSIRGVCQTTITVFLNAAPTEWFYHWTSDAEL